MDNEFTIEEFKRYLLAKNILNKKHDIILHSCRHFEATLFVSKRKIKIQEGVKGGSIHIVCEDSSKKTWETFLYCIQALMERLKLTPDNLFPHKHTDKNIKCPRFTPEQLLQDLNNL